MPSKLNLREWSVKSGRRRRLLTALLERDGGKCRYCDVPVFRNVENIRPMPPNAATIEHFPVPKRCLRPDQWFDIDRVILACFACNQRQELEGGLLPLDFVAPSETLPPGIMELRLRGLL